MTDSLQLLNLVHAAIVAANTDAGGQVFKPGDWPTQDGQYPIIKMRLVLEDRQSLARSGEPQFITVATIRLSQEVSAPARLDDLGATEAEAKAWRLKRQCDAAIVNSYPLTSVIQRIVSMRSQLAFNSDAATHLAGIQTDIALEFYEGAENFAPVEADDIDEVHVDVPTFAGIQAVISPLT